MRSVTLPGFLRDELAKHLADYPPVQGGLVFTTEEGHAINRNNFRNRVWLKALGDAGFQKPYPRVHDLRHTSVSLAIAAGAHPKEIQARAGHSSITVTLDRYGHLFPGMDEALADKLDGMGRADDSVVASWWPSDDSTVIPLRDKEAETTG